MALSHPRALRLTVWSGPFLALAVSFPALDFPFLSDDWANLEAAGNNRLMSSPFMDFRPLYMLTYWLDLRLWGSLPRGFHLTNVVLIAIAVALLIRLTTLLTRDPWIAGMSGALFALHPYHVENAAWVSARSDSLLAVCYLSALIAFERWRVSPRTLPWATLIWAEAALLSKETAITLPLVLLLRWHSLKGAPSSGTILRRGVLPILLQALAHFLIVRPLALGGPGRTLMSSLGPSTGTNLLSMAGAAILPFDAEVFGSAPILCGTAALAAWLLLALPALALSSRYLPLAFGAAGGAVISLAPYAVGFQERYLFLPGVAFAILLAALLASLRAGIRRVLVVSILIIWIGCLFAQWQAWGEAAAASRQQLEDLARMVKSSDVSQVLLANTPFRVRGSSVAGDFEAALRVQGARAVQVRSATWISYPGHGAVALARPPESMMVGGTRWIVVRLRTPDSLYSTVVAPPLSDETTAHFEDTVRLRRETAEIVRVELRAGPDRAIGAWDRGRIVWLSDGDRSLAAGGTAPPPPGSNAGDAP